MRFDEFQEERAYSKEEISVLVDESGLELSGSYKPFEFATVSDNDERVFFVISKKMG